MSGALRPDAPPGLAIALAVRFVIELALLVGVAVIAMRLFPQWWGWLIAIGGVVVVATFWGVFLSPKAAVPLPAVAKLVIEAVLFVGVGTGLFLLDLAIPAVVGVAAWIIDRIAIALLED
ncbi:MAG: DUF2568 domain-containing protein [Candidatus Leucobacter sulfamidivorax]|nr:DUF2568 domain-containing protein [Candidatus Leucobacter sulfamidivorax]